VVYIGERLKEIRQREVLTQEDLAEKAGVHVQSIIKIENNHVQPYPSTIRKLARALGVQPRELTR
jgi:transcriptional regulator with XRE-family HTH domain